MEKKIIILGLIVSLLVGALFLFKEIKNNSKNLFYFSKSPEIASGVVPHHLLAEEIIEKFFNYIASKEKTETIILLSPDHFNSGNFTEENQLILPQKDTNELNGIAIDKFLLEKIAENSEFTFNTSFVSFDQGITNLLPYIKKNFPETKILPILIPAETKKEKIEKFIKTIDSFKKNQIVLASTDFSHYLPKEVADFHDIKSINTLINFKEDDFERLEVDCWQCLYAARLFAQLKNKESPKIIAHKNSADLSGFDSDETTSYFSVVFEKEPSSLKENPENFQGKTILFVGDIMFDRGVEYQMEKNNIFYPFQKIEPFLRGVDIVFGNLEGPIVETPRNFSDNSLMFAFNQNVIEALSFGNFNLLSLANNHTLNMGKIGLKETREFLEKGNIFFAGDPISCSEDFLFKEDEKIILFALNKTFASNCSNEEVIKKIKSIKLQYPYKFLIISVHWGTEYELENSIYQQELAHKIIDAGADLIIGHHPHVVQTIQSYKGKLIFYSLGNFIFDQYFSKETQEELAVGLEIHPNKKVYRFFPIQSHLSQPYLMKGTKRNDFLESLAERSEKELSEGIRKGIIELGI